MLCKISNYLRVSKIHLCNSNKRVEPKKVRAKIFITTMLTFRWDPLGLRRKTIARAKYSFNRWEIIRSHHALKREYNR